MAKFRRTCKDAGTKRKEVALTREPRHFLVFCSGSMASAPQEKAKLFAQRSGNKGDARKFAYTWRMEGGDDRLVRWQKRHYAAFVDLD